MNKIPVQKMGRKKTLFLMICIWVTSKPFFGTCKCTCKSWLAVAAERPQSIRAGAPVLAWIGAAFINVNSTCFPSFSDRANTLEIIDPGNTLCAIHTGIWCTHVRYNRTVSPLVARLTHTKVVLSVDSIVHVLANTTVLTGLRKTVVNLFAEFAPKSIAAFTAKVRKAEVCVTLSAVGAQFTSKSTFILLHTHVQP